MTSGGIDGGLVGQLLRPLQPEEAALLEIIFEPMYGPVGGWPVWDHVQRTLWQKMQVDASLILPRLPFIADQRLASSSSYGLVWRSAGGTPTPIPSEKIGLTVAGLRQLGTPAAQAMAAWLVDFTKGIAQAEVRLISPRADQVANDEVDVGFLLEKWDPTMEIRIRPSSDALIELAMHEPLITAPYGTAGTFKVHADARLRPFINVSDVNDYLSITVNTIGIASLPVSPRPVSPLTLPQTLDYLSVVIARDPRLKGTNLLSSHALVSSYARLATGVDTYEEFVDRMSALYDVLSKIAVPKLDQEELKTMGESEQPKPVRRLGFVLRRALGDESADRIDSAIGVILAALQVRGSIIHSDAVNKIVSAHSQLGLPYPITDYGRAWDIVRARVTDALDLLRIELDVTRED